MARLKESNFLLDASGPQGHANQKLIDIAVGIEPGPGQQIDIDDDEVCIWFMRLAPPQP